jgi:hypothetical protein
MTRMFFTRIQVDGNAKACQVLSEGSYLTLWLEVPPFGNPPPSRTKVDGKRPSF